MNLYSIHVILLRVVQWWLLSLVYFRYLMCQSKEDLYRLANWPGVNGGARQRLLDTLQGRYMYMYECTYM